MIEGQNSGAGAVILRAREEHERQLREMRQTEAASGTYAGAAEALRQEYNRRRAEAEREFRDLWDRVWTQDYSPRIARLEAEAQRAELAKMEAINLARAQQAAAARAEAIQQSVNAARREAAAAGVSLEEYLAWRASAG